jgi:ribose transport system substrate-binding protein
VRAVASGQWAATFTYPTGAAESLDLAKKILLDCAESVPDTVTVPTLAITKDNAADLDKKLKF